MSNSLRIASSKQVIGIEGFLTPVIAFDKSSPNKTEF